MKLWLIVVLMFLGCSPSEDTAKEENKKSETSKNEQKPFSVEEPVVSNVSKNKNAADGISSSLVGRNRSIRLTGLGADTQNANFFIDDDIIFSKNENEKESKNTQNFKDVHFDITVECVEHDSKITYQKKTQMKYKNQVSLMEILPVEIFTDGNRWWEEEDTRLPSCTVDFTAKNKQGDVHLFNLPNLAVRFFEEGRFLNLISRDEGAGSAFFFEEIGNLSLRKDLLAKVSELELSCKGKNPVEINLPQQKESSEEKSAKETGLPPLNEKTKNSTRIQTASTRFSVEDQQIYDLWVYEDFWLNAPAFQDLSQKNGRLTCRFIGYGPQKEVTASSELFPVVFTHRPLKVAVTSRTNNEGAVALNNFKQKYIRGKIDEVEDQNFLSLSIENKNNYPVSLYLPASEFQVDYTAFYKGLDHPVVIDFKTLVRPDPPLQTRIMKQVGYFVQARNNAYFYLNKDQLEGEKFLTIDANSSVVVDLILESIDDACTGSLSGERVGFAFDGPSFPIYRVLNNNNLNIAEASNIGLIKWSKKEVRENKEGPFFFGAYASNNERDLKRSYFFETTCYSAQLRKFHWDDAAVAWRVRYKAESKKLWMEKAYKSLQSAMLKFYEDEIKAVQKANRRANR